MNRKGPEIGYNRNYFHENKGEDCMPIRIGPLELVIILVIVLLLFGVGRIGKIAGELGTGIRSFREGLQGKEKDEEAATAEETPKES
jgi:sec-independent protein translocase protein TatA